MKLNLDCVRQILLCVEANTGLRKYCFFIDSDFEKVSTDIGREPISAPAYQTDLLKHFDNDELIYHINYCVKANLLSVYKPPDPYQIIITDLTPYGHDFLENIRDNQIWSDVKEASKKVGSKSLDAITQIASNVITQIIKNQFGM